MVYPTILNYSCVWSLFTSFHCQCQDDGKKMVMSNWRRHGSAKRKSFETVPTWYVSPWAKSYVLRLSGSDYGTEISSNALQPFWTQFGTTKSPLVNLCHEPQGLKTTIQFTGLLLVFMGKNAACAESNYFLIKLVNSKLSDSWQHSAVFCVLELQCICASSPLFACILIFRGIFLFGNLRVTHI